MSDTAELPLAARIHPANGVLRFFVDNPALSKLGVINSYSCQEGGPQCVN